MKILHIADTHFGAKLSGFNLKAIKFIKSRIEETIKNLEITLKTNTYDGFIMAGDIFDSPNVSPYYIKKVENLFKIVLDRGGFVVYATGNHDYFISQKHFNNINSYQNFILFTDDRVQKKEINYNNQKVAFYGIGYQTYHPRMSLHSKFMPKGDEDVAIAVLHGDVYAGNSEAKSDYYSISSNELIQKNYDYTALGHIHIFNDFGSNIIYPGCPYGQGMDETGAKYVVSVDINNGITTYQKNKISSYQILDLKFETVVKDRYELAVKLKNFLTENTDDSLENHILRVRGILKGFEDFLDFNDPEFRREIFSSQTAFNHRLEFEITRKNNQPKHSIPPEMLQAIEEAIKEFTQSEETSYQFSKLDCNLNVSEIIKERDYKLEILDIMRHSYEN